MLKGKKIILGITGSIAAYKAAFLLRGLVKEGAEVQVLMTPAGKEFITPVTMSALSGKPVLGEFFQTGDGTWHSHVDLGLWADVMLVAPASANTLSKMANGIADNLLLTTYLSAKCPVFIAPAMDLDMFEHPATQKNIETLMQYGCQLIEPGSGELASGLWGKGRMQEPEIIIERLKHFFLAQIENSSVKGKSFLITAGPTHEKIDPVRFIGNYSSGKMGFAIAKELANRGAKVKLVSGPTHLELSHPNVEVFKVVSALEMSEKCQHIFPLVDGAIMSAAVADYTPVVSHDHKIKRNSEAMHLELKATDDIAALLGTQKKQNQLLVGFALETQDEMANAHKKMEKKNLDFIVVNSLADEGAGFGVDTNKITIIDRENNNTFFTLKSKELVAVDIVTKLESYF